MRLNDIIYEVYGGIDFAELPDIPFHGIKNAKILYSAITRVFETYLGEPYGEKYTINSSYQIRFFRIVEKIQFEGVNLSLRYIV